MALDRTLSPDFSLREFTGWRAASENQVARLQETVTRVLQPARNRFGRIVPTSWVTWSDGTARTGAHAHGGTVDFVSLDAPLEDVFRWGLDYLLPEGYVGRWIYEPTMHDDDGRRIQGEHIHVAPRSDMLAAFGKGDVGAFRETAPGEYEPVRFGGDFGGATGAYGDPIQIPGLVVSVGRGLWRWVFLGILAGAILRPRGAPT